MATHPQLQDAAEFFDELFKEQWCDYLECYVRELMNTYAASRCTKNVHKQASRLYQPRQPT